MNPDLELIKQYAQAIQATGMLEEDTVNGITAMVERARDQFRVADEQGISRETNWRVVERCQKDLARKN